MSGVVSTVKLQLNRRRETFVVPLLIAGTYAVITALSALVFWRAGQQPGSKEWIQMSQSNPGIVFGFVGVLLYYGVAAVAKKFPFALALGATRRAFVTGTLLWNTICAAWVAVILGVLNAIEIATNHWFVGLYIFDIYVLGGGDTLRLLLIVFLGALSALTIGGVFAAGWIRFKALGPLLVAGALIIASEIEFLILVPEGVTIAAGFQPWWLIIAAVPAIVLSAAGTWLFLRTASVR